MLHNGEEILLFKKKKNTNKKSKYIFRTPNTYARLYFLADFRLMCIIQPAACTAVDKKQNDMLTDHPCQDSLLILNVAFLFPLVVCLFFWVLLSLFLQICLKLSSKLVGKVKSPV